MPHARCSACGSLDLRPFYEQRQAPLSGCLVFASRTEAGAFPRADLRLAFCRACGFIQNVLFQAERLECLPGCDAGPGDSPQLRQLDAALAQRLVTQYGLASRSVAAIGSESEGLVSALAGASGGQSETLGPYFNGRHTKLTGDFIVCRHTLAHVADAARLVGGLRKAIGKRREPVVYFEVPDVLRVLNELAFWDVHYDQAGYFSAGSLARLFRRQGFDVYNLGSGFDGHNLQLEAVASNGGNDGPVWDAEHDLPALERAVAYFHDHYEAKRIEWSRRLDKLHQDGARIVLWGAGSRAVSFIHGLGLQDEVEFVVDSNPRRQGRYVAGGGQQVVASAFLTQYKPDLIVALDNAYIEAIRGELATLSVSAELMSL